MSKSKFNLVLALLVTAWLVGQTIVPAAADGWEGPDMISDGTSPQSGWMYPQVAVKDEYIHAVWRDGWGTDVQYRRSTDNGASWGTIKTFNCAGVEQPHVAVSGDGQYVHIVGEGGGDGSSPYNITYARSTDYGESLNPTADLAPAQTDPFAPDVAAYGNNVYAVWIGDAPDYDVYFSRSTDNGANWSAPQNLTSTTAIEEDEPRVAAYGTNVYVVWLSDDDIVFVRSTNSGAAWGSTLTLWSNAPFGEQDISIAAYDTNVYVNREDNSTGPLQRKSTNSGISFASAVSLGSGNDREPEVHASSAYTSIGATVSMRTADGGIYVTTSAGSETKIGTVNPSPSSCLTDIGAADSGAMHVVYNSRDGNGNHQIYYYRTTVDQDFGLWSPHPAITGVHNSDDQWGDFDGDGDLDLVICGEDSGANLVTQTYENQSGALVLHQNLEGIKGFKCSGNLAWGDYDNDGDLDLAMAGEKSDAGLIARVYKNDGSGNLTHDTTQVLTGVSRGSVAWGDYDSDGDLDLVVTGHDGSQPSTILYRNNPGHLLIQDPNQSLTGLYSSSADWADYDGDGDLDLLLTGYDGAAIRTILYENDPIGTLTEIGGHGLPNVWSSDAAWGDYDSDGDLDLAITGATGTGTQTSRIYENVGGGNFALAASGFLDVYQSSVAWGDYDNDGDLDFAICGYTGYSLHTSIYENTGAGFSATSFSFPGLYNGSISWADVDGDGDLDLFMTGYYNWTTPYAKLYENIGGASNSAPSPPTTLVCDACVPGGITFSWDGASDSETPTSGLYYCVRIGYRSGGHEVVSGTYGTPLMGNRGQGNELFLQLPPGGTYYWSVRAVDSGLRASSWSNEQVCHHEYHPADSNDDCEVNLKDLAILARHWLEDYH